MFDQIACVRCAHIAEPTSSCAQTRTRCVAQLLARRTVSQKCAYASRIGGQLYFVPRNMKKNVVFKATSQAQFFGTFLREDYDPIILLFCANSILISIVLIYLQQKEGEE